MIERRRAAAHAFVIDINVPFLNDDDFHHLAKVLRLRSGETVSVSDGRGSWRICHYEMSAALATGDSVVHIETNPRSLSVAFSVTKNDKPDLVIQKLTELGIDHIIPIITERSIVRWDGDKGAKNQVRWQKSPAKPQCKVVRCSCRPFMMCVHPLKNSWKPMGRILRSPIPKVRRLLQTSQRL